jgi:catechol 2,3-dioxygenase-like lactoylglutathione lyase family enzyme
MVQTPSLEVILWATDVPALAAFLEEVVGLEIVEQHPGYARLGTADATSLSIHADEAYQGHPWFEALRHEGLARGIGAELRFPVADVTEAYRLAIRTGASVVYPPHEQEDGVECQVLAPDGYLVTLRQPAG